MAAALVIGVDAGGTRVRALVADVAGTRLGTGLAGAANPVSQGRERAVAAIADAVTAALSTVDDPGRVAAMVVGLAGAETVADDLADAVRSAVVDIGPQVRTELRSDIEVAFAAGTSELDGVLVLAGTGAVVAEVREGRLRRRLDGHGWLLGDDGSAMWLGREVVRAALADLERRGPPTVLTAPVCLALQVPAPLCSASEPGSEPAVVAILRAVYASPPIALARLAPLASTMAAAGDRVASELIIRAAALLLDEVSMLRAATSTAEVVLAGSVLLAEGPLRAAVRAGLRTRFGVEPVDARDGAAGAAWSAIRLLDAGADPAVHAHLVATA
ncbi:MAG: hypothetical protein DLM56_10580 [Pseudonocardiales bacterium]|nr:MAG: hypothetical protein DLM56_10580 [Pseudonocardiales bacterium]